MLVANCFCSKDFAFVILRENYMEKYNYRTGQVFVYDTAEQCIDNCDILLVTSDYGNKSLLLLAESKFKKVVFLNELDFLKPKSEDYKRPLENIYDLTIPKISIMSVGRCSQCAVVEIMLEKVIESLSVSSDCFLSSEAKSYKAALNELCIEKKSLTKLNTDDAEKSKINIQVKRFDNSCNLSEISEYVKNEITADYIVLCVQSGINTQTVEKIKNTVEYCCVSRLSSTGRYKPSFFT